MPGAATRINQTLKQRIASHTVCAVEAGIGRFANGIKVGNVGSASVVGSDAATAIMGGGHNGDRLARNIHSPRGAMSQNCREVMAYRGFP